jgi:hypothetical protein
MNRNSCVMAVVLVLFCAGIAGAQEYPIMNKVADKIIQKYQQSTCQQLWQQKQEPKSPKEQEVVQILQSDPQMRTAFINKISPTIVNKMFECGMVP